MRFIKLTLSAVAALALFVGLQFKFGPAPPLGAFLNPFGGFWQNGTALDAPPETLEADGLQAPVEVAWDARRVPHVFARNEHDLYFAQGYLTARDRLWQMDLQTRAAGGRLAEVLGPDLLSFDRSRRRLGFVYGAERSVDAMLADPILRVMLEAYAAGINAYIAELGAAELPLEYKLLDFAPEPWTPLRTALLLKYMSWDLTGRNNEVAMTRTAAALGEEAMAELFPYQAPFLDPIIPPDHAWAFDPVPRPDRPAETPTSAVEPPMPPDAPSVLNGSNNWAVAGSRTASGKPLLANDPHLGLSLPSIWYEMQLSAPGIDVYGVTLPGAPGVIIGFNEHVAWGVTNAGSDVMDWYEITFEDSTYAAYRYDGGWRETSTRLEPIAVRGEATVVDTVVYTHHGPVAYRGDEPAFNGSTPHGAALRWIAHEPSTELLTFYLLNRARGYADYREALTHYTSPAQNFVFADTAGTIAIRHNGKLPLRWPGQGRYLSDGSDPAYDWHGWIPYDEVPGIADPPRGFVSSANQNPVDEAYPYYLGWDYATFERGARVNELLAARDDFTPEDMQALQLDDVYLHARMVLPAMLRMMADADLAPEQQEILDVLRAWDYTYGADERAPIIYDAWWNTLSARIWNDDLGGLRKPDDDVTAALLLEDPAHRYFDDRATPLTETARELVPAAFADAFTGLRDELGPFGEGWAWGRARGTDIEHLASIPGLGRPGLPTSGRARTVNAMSETHGPSWRMVVSLEDSVRAWGIYPGGPSGHPGSRFYDSMVDDWVAGELYPLLLLETPDADDERIAACTTMLPD